MVNTYCVDCYRSNALAVTTFLNVLRQVIGFTMAFWIPPLIDAVNFGLGIGVLAIVCFFFYALVSENPPCSVLLVC